MIIDVDTVFGFWASRRVDITLGRLLRVMRQHSIDRALTSSTRGVCYDYLDGNEETLAETLGLAELVPVMTVDPRRYLGVRDEIRRRVADGHRLFRLFPEYQGWTLDTPSARKVLGFLEEAGAVILVGGPASAILPAVRTLQTPVVLTSAHFYTLSDVLASVDDLGHVYLSTRLLIGPGSLEIAASALGWQRLVFGSHSPLEYTGAALDLILRSELPQPQKQAVLGGNMVEFLERGGTRIEGH